MNDEEDTTDCIQVTLTRSPLYGFGIAVNGGNDSDDNQSLIVSDVIKNGPADGKLLPNDRIVNVNGHPVVRRMEHVALKLIRESTDFVNLIIERHKHPMMMSNPNAQIPLKCILNKSRKSDKFGIILNCQYYIKRINPKNNQTFADIQENDEVIKINDVPVNRLTLQDAQKLIDKAKERLVLDIIPNKVHRQSLTHPNPHVYEQSITNHPIVRPCNITRYISFFTDTSSIGIRLAGGNKYGLFICEIQPNSIAQKAGLFIADKIFSVNNIDFTNVTREDAVLYLMNMKVSQVNMIVSNLPDEYDQLLGDIGGDSFFIRTHFAHNASHTEELSFGINDIFHVTDTLYNGQIGYWVATKLNRVSLDQKQTGAIPNQSKAEQIAEVAPRLDELIKLKQSSFKRKLRTKFNDKRSRSTLSLNYLKEDSVLSRVACWKPMTKSHFSAYERVRLKSITIIRPVVFLGPLSDIARDRLLEQYPDKFELPDTYIESSTKAHANIIKLQSIKNVIQKNRHCILDISPSAIEQLNYAECYPIVIYFKFSNRRLIKKIRSEYGKIYQKSSRRLFEHAEHLEYFYSYLFTSIIHVDSIKSWYETLKFQIEFQQEEPIWMSHDRFIEKDLLHSDEYFISRRLSDSDEYSIPDRSSLCLDTINNKEKSCLQRVFSDPMMFRKNKILKTFSTDLPNQLSNDEEEEEEEEDNNSVCLQTSAMPSTNQNQTLIDMSTIDQKKDQHQSDLLYSNNSLVNQRSFAITKIHNPIINNNNNNDPLFQKQKLNLNRISSLNQYGKTYNENKSKFNPSNSVGNNETITNPNSTPKPFISQKIFSMNYNEQVMSPDTLKPLSKNHIDKSTMTERNSTEKNFCVVSNRSATSSRPTILLNDNNIGSRRYTSIESGLHHKHDPLVNVNEKISLESSPKQNIYSNRKLNLKSNSVMFPSSPSTRQLRSTSSLQKPRVYTHDDASLLNQRKLILSSSSESSTCSLKDKTIKEVGETRSYSIQDGSNVIGSARGIIDYHGGKLSCPLTGVSLFIPMGAIPENVQQEIYFQVHQDDSHTEKFHGQLLSPIVICGPHGIKFQKSVELTIPHTAGHDAQKLSLLLHDTNQDSKTNYPQQSRSFKMNRISHVTDAHVSILVDHF